MNTKDDKPNEVPEAAKSVGYGTPPEATRFRRGVSGNPRGRPRGSLNVATVFTKTLRERVVINENGQRKTVTKLEAALKQMVNKAASGDIRALRELLELVRDAEARQNVPGVQNPVIEGLDQEVIDGIMQRLNPGEEGGQELQEAAQEASDVDDQHG
jgi:Family of unknown function (DUF5681)